MPRKPKKKPRYRMKLRKLNFVSAVDTPAQETASVRLVKRGSKDERLEVKLIAKATGTSDDELGLVFGWALTSQVDGLDYYDLHNDNIVQEDLIKVAAEFMESGGPSDEMHDRDQDGRVVLCMPWTTEVEKQMFGGTVESGTYGLMIAMKPSAEVFAKFKSGELSAFSIDASAVREEISEKSADETQKRGILTDAADGHAHLIDDEAQSGRTSWESGSSEEGSHSHPWAKSEDGSIQIGEANGHTHAILASEPKRSSPMPAKKNNTPDQSPELAAALAQVQLLSAVVALNAEERSHYDGLSTDTEKSAFLELDSNQRSDVLRKSRDADPVVYTARNGTEYRKSADPGLVAAIKTADAAVERMEQQSAEMVAQKYTRDAEKSLANLPGDIAIRAALLQAIDAYDCSDEVRKGMHDAVKAGDTAISTALSTIGTKRGPTDTTKAAGVSFLQRVTEIQKRDNISRTDAMAKAPREYPDEFAAWQGH